MFLKKYQRLLFRIALSGAVLYIIFIAIGMLFYPGGSHVDPNTVGYSFFANSLSDIGRTIAINGELNSPAMVCFFIGTTAFSISIFAFSCAYGNIETTTKASQLSGQLANGFGILASIATLIYTYAPADTMRGLHLIGVYIAYLSTFLFTLLFGIMTAIEGDKSKTKHWRVSPFIFFTFAGLYLISLIILVQNFTPVLNQVMQKSGRLLMLLVIIVLSGKEWVNKK